VCPQPRAAAADNNIAQPPQCRPPEKEKRRCHNCNSSVVLSTLSLSPGFLEMPWDIQLVNGDSCALSIDIPTKSSSNQTLHSPQCPHLPLRADGGSHACSTILSGPKVALLLRQLSGGHKYVPDSPLLYHGKFQLPRNSCLRTSGKRAAKSGVNRSQAAIVWSHLTLWSLESGPRPQRAAGQLGAGGAGQDSRGWAAGACNLASRRQQCICVGVDRGGNAGAAGHSL
jgi:hypothetical protein